MIKYLDGQSIVKLCKYVMDDENSGFNAEKVAAIVNKAAENETFMTEDVERVLDKMEEGIQTIRKYLSFYRDFHKDTEQLKEKYNLSSYMLKKVIEEEDKLSRYNNI